jgi:putative Holliday junction resolvase
MHNSAKPLSLMAFDFGLKQIGVAYGQTITNHAKGLTIIKAQNGVPSWHIISELLDKWKPNILLVGLPLNMDSSESELSGKARKFARRLQGRFPIQVKMVDERLSSREAKAIIRENLVGRVGQHADLTKIDHIAAAVILQSWFDDPSIETAV